MPPFGQPFQVRDLDEFGDALTSGALTPAQAAEGLARVQRFIDTYLRGELRPTPGTAWADFPPAAIADLR